MPPILTVAAVIANEQGQVLLVRKRASSIFIQPGGKIEPGETPGAAAVRELREEVGADLDVADLVPLGVWTAPAANEPGHTVRGHVFEHPWVSGLSVRAEIDDLMWLHPTEMGARSDLAPLLVTCVLPALPD